METTVIDIDFSTDPAKTGLARATVDDASEKAVVHEVCTASVILRPRVEMAARRVLDVCNRMPTLIAIDAPLGWPDAMRDHSFTAHMAGHPLEICANRLFSRETDRKVMDRLKKKPLEVGANLIARAAHGALGYLQELNGEMNGQGASPLPLAWSPEDLKHQSCCVVEVYPGATMKAHNIDPGDYKKTGVDGQDSREAIVEALVKQGLVFETDTFDVARNDHTVDAAACVLAGRDFVARRAKEPDSDTRWLAEREGWIWVKHRD